MGLEDVSRNVLVVGLICMISLCSMDSVVEYCRKIMFVRGFEFKFLRIGFGIES